MTDLMETIRKYKSGEIDIQILINKVCMVANLVSNEIQGGGIDAYSFRQPVYDELQYLQDASCEDNSLRLDALLCDIANNLAHSLLEKNKVHKTQRTTILASEMMGVKKGMSISIIKECLRTGNKSYGLKEGGFFVDIPMCGQIGWHFPGHCGLKAKAYDFPIEIKSVEYPNKKFLCEGLKKDELHKFSERLKKVIECEDIETLNESLYSQPDFISKLVSQTNQPSEKDLLFEKEQKTEALIKKIPDDLV